MSSTSACPAADHGLANGIKRRSFSLLLARRYLNPRRSMLSSFSLISLIGVMLGVLVLVVVMAVYAGLERNVKSRLLGFTPHIRMNHLTPTSVDGRMTNWQEAAAKAEHFPMWKPPPPSSRTTSSSMYQAWQHPVMFRGIDTSDPAQVEGIAEMLDLEKYPDSTADLGIDDRVVDFLHPRRAAPDRSRRQDPALSTRNFEGVMRAYKTTDNPPVREAFKPTRGTSHRHASSLRGKPMATNSPSPLTSLPRHL